MGPVPDHGGVRDLPDLIGGVGGVAELNQYGMDGVLYPVDSLQSVMPNLKAFYEKFPDALERNTAGDGHVYFVPGGYVESLWRHGTGVRADELAKVGFDPETADSYEGYTGAFSALRQANDGRPPISHRSGVYGLLRVPMWAAGLERRGMSYDDGSQSWFYNFTHPNARFVIEWLAENYRLGNFHPDILTMGEDIWEPAIAAFEFTGIISENIYAFGYRAVTRAKADDPNLTAEYVALRPPKFNGEQLAWRQFPLGEPEVGLSADTQHAELIGSMLDYFKTVQGHAEARYGREGVDWVMHGGIPRIMYDIPGNEYAQLLRNEGFDVKTADAYNTWWNTEWGYVKFPGDMAAFRWEFGATNMQQNPKWATDFNPKYDPVATLPPAPTVALGAAEQEEANSLMNSLNTAAGEFVANVIVGNRSIDEWPVFQDQLRSLGAERLAELYNSAR